MKVLFRNLAAAMMVLLVGLTLWGHFLPREAGAVTAFDVLLVIVTVFGLLVHSIVYTYFIASGKFAESAVEEHGYSQPAVVGRMKSNKLKAFRYAFLAMMAIMMAAGLAFWSSPVRGGDAIWRGWAAIAAWLAILLNAYVVSKEWRFIVANSAITEGILDEVSERRESAAATGGASDRSPGLGESR